MLEVLVLRATNDVNIWRRFVVAMLVCDVGHAYANWVEIGTRGFVCLWLWAEGDVVTMGVTLGPLGVRELFLLGVGFEKG